MRYTAQGISMVTLLAISATLSCNFTLEADSEKSMQTEKFYDDVKKIVEKNLPGAQFEAVTISMPFDRATSPLKAIKARYERLIEANKPYDYMALQATYPAFTELAKSMKKNESFVNRDYGSFFDQMQTSKLKAEGLSDAEIARLRKFGLFWARMEPLVQAERKGKAFFSISTPDTFKSDADLDAYIALIKEMFPKAAEQLDAKAQKYQAIVVIKQSSNLSRLENLESDLVMHGFKLIDQESSSQQYRFDTEEEAIAYFEENQIEKSKFLSSFNQEPAASVTLEWPIPVSKDPSVLANYMLLAHLTPKSIVKQVDANHYQITTPAYVRASVERTYLLIARDPQGPVSAASDPAELLIRIQTDGTNYGVTNEMVAEKVRAWDKLYGVKVTKASRDSFTLLFSRLPDDLSPLCSEFFMLCGNLLEHGDEEEHAVAMRKTAATLRKTQKMVFWWD